MKRSITGILECNLATDQVFEAGVFDREVDVLICSLVFDVVCTDTHSLEIIMSRALRSADNLPLQITLLVISLCIFAMSCLKCLRVAFLPSLFMLQVPVRLGVAGGAGLPGRAPLLGGQRAAARAGHQSGAHKHIAT